jgi:hypothetical protein
MLLWGKVFRFTEIIFSPKVDYFLVSGSTDSDNYKNKCNVSMQLILLWLQNMLLMSETVLSLKSGYDIYIYLFQDLIFNTYMSIKTKDATLYTISQIFFM